MKLNDNTNTLTLYNEIEIYQVNKSGSNRIVLTKEDVIKIVEELNLNIKEWVDNE